jgi:hypothetical protein
MNNHQGLLDEIASCDASIAQCDEALRKVIGTEIRKVLVRIRLEMLRTKVRLLNELRSRCAADLERIAA